MTRFFSSGRPQDRESLVGLAIIALTLILLLPVLKAEIRGLRPEMEPSGQPFPLQATLVKHTAPSAPQTVTATAEEAR